jgi:dipeptidyl aminopeptidase/acylaminoacyl peptidase
MTLNLRFLLALIPLAGVPASGAQIARLAVEDFARESGTSRAQISPDGKYLAFVRNFDGRPQLHVTEIDAKRTERLDLGEAALANNATKEVGPFQWVGDHRLIITTLVWDAIYGVIAADWNGDNARPISGYEDNVVLLHGSKLWAREVIHTFHDKNQRVLMLDRHEDGGGTSNRPDVLEVSTTDGLASTVVKNPGGVSAWGVDADGVVRLGILSQDQLSGAIYRETEKAPWRTILPLKNRIGSIRPVGFDAANNRIFVAALTDEKRWTVFPLDSVSGELGAPLLADPEYDILPDHFIPTIDGHALCSPIFSPKKNALLGVRYVTDAPRVKWFDREFIRYQAAVDRAAPNTVNLLVGMSLNGKRLLWFGYSDQDPGVYFLADMEKHTFKPFAAMRSWINPATQAPMLAVKYNARDGLLIHGFLTVPVGHEPKKLPLIVLPHGGPWVRDVWGYDPLVQLLANRGYAVLQINYRGSPGYGEELYANAKRQVGHQIQDDIEDATRWAISAGVADEHRIAIMGMSYGGYSTLFALGHNPDLYQCGISVAGVTDWPTIYSTSDVAEYKDAVRYWREQIGDPNSEMLKQISPVNFADKITAPLLIIQGKEDRRVPQDQAKRMIAALEKFGHKPDSLFVSGVAHNFGREKNRIEIYRRITDFLEKHLGPGVD